MDKSKVYFPNLDALRFFAFLLVYLRHGFGDVVSQIDLGHPALTLVKDGLFHSGEVGVSFFFVLSGFLITYLILKEIELTGTLDVKAFYIRRCLRIWPLYFAVVGIGFALVWMAPWGGENLGSTPPAFCYLLFLSNFAPLAGYVIPLFIGITWSVAIEEQFYVVWPLLFAFTPRRLVKLIFPLVIIVSIAFRAVHRNQPLVLYVHSVSVMSDLAVGGLVAYLALNSKRFIRYCERMKSWQIIMAYLIGAAIVLLRSAMYAETDSNVVMRIESLLVIFRRLILSGFFAFIIMEQNWASSSFIKVSRLRTISSLGKYTYGLYLLHPIGLLLAAVCLGELVGTRGEHHPSLSCALLGFPMSLALSMASYHFYEMPFLKLKKQFAHVASGRG